MHHRAPTFTILHLVAPTCTFLQQSAPTCTNLHQLLLTYTILNYPYPICNTLLHPVSSCSNLHYPAAICTILHHLAPFCTILHHVAPIYTILQNYGINIDARYKYKSCWCSCFENALISCRKKPKMKLNHGEIRYFSLHIIHTLLKPASSCLSWGMSHWTDKDLFHFSWHN